MLVLPPSFYPVTQVDLIAYFTHIAEVTGNLPFQLYNFPECFRNNIEIDTLTKLSEQVQMAGIKQSGKDFAYHHDLVHMGRQKNLNC